MEFDLALVQIWHDIHISCINKKKPVGVIVAPHFAPFQ